MKNITTDIVLVNWNSGNDLRHCLSVLADVDCQDLIDKIVVVDNNSTDQSLEDISSRLTLSVIRNKYNVGFAAACNQGARLGDAPYVLFLNVDLVLGDGAISDALEFIDQKADQNVAICGVALTHPDGRVQPTVARFPTAAMMVGIELGLDRLGTPLFPSLIVDPEHLNETQEVDHVIGAFFLVRRSVFKALDGFDEQFFVFYEDLDFSLRAHDAGWKSMYLASVRALHDAESDRSTPFRVYLSRRGRILYAWKHFSVPGAFAVSIATLFGEPLVRLAVALVSFSVPGIRTTLGATRYLWGELPGILFGRIRKRPKYVAGRGHE